MIKIKKTRKTRQLQAKLPMNMTYDPKVDALYIKLTAKTVVRSQRVTPQVSLDFDADDALIGVEVLDARRTGINPLEVVMSLGLPDNPITMPSADEMREGRAERMRALKQQREKIIESP